MAWIYSFLAGITAFILLYLVYQFVKRTAWVRTTRAASWKQFLLILKFEVARIMRTLHCVLANVCWLRRTLLWLLPVMKLYEII
jgi:uncharacterized membrane-anchored protein